MRYATVKYTMAEPIACPEETSYRTDGEPLEELGPRPVEARLQHRVEDDAAGGCDEQEEGREAMLRRDEEEGGDHDDHHDHEAGPQRGDLEKRPLDPRDAVSAHPAHHGFVERLGRAALDV